MHKDGAFVVRIEVGTDLWETAIGQCVALCILNRNTVPIREEN